ncbi:MAG: peptide chain release factor N(5)-glutamine methyltransferase [Chloroflexota bacterium]|nr:peptide chain release factor N(5)-glutamine methyltransferase [Chloroflexota bacterium]MDE2886542.1 peptide chain release factor N(5)-glutamine methyltransferase [Chloroflexota bacterium]
MHATPALPDEVPASAGTTGLGAGTTGEHAPALTLGHLVQRTARRLEAAGIGDARLEADLIWTTALGIDRAALYAAFRDTPSAEQAGRAEALCERRLNREPVAYLMGTREFYGLPIDVGPGVLIPRPETETVVEETLRLVEGVTSPVLADVGSGSGAIAVALAVARPDAFVYALDVAPRALELTAHNAAVHGVGERVHVLESDLLAALPRRAHVVAANLPYVMSGEIPLLEPEVSRYEPREALDGGVDGLMLVRRLLAEAGGRLLPAGALVLEMDPRQITAAGDAAASCFPGARIRAARDLWGRERVLVMENAPGR